MVPVFVLAHPFDWINECLAGISPWLLFARYADKRRFQAQVLMPVKDVYDLIYTANKIINDVTLSVTYNSSRFSFVLFTVWCLIYGIPFCITSFCHVCYFCELQVWRAVCNVVRCWCQLHWCPFHDHWPTNTGVPQWSWTTCQKTVTAHGSKVFHYSSDIIIGQNCRFMYHRFFKVWTVEF